MSVGVSVEKEKKVSNKTEKKDKYTKRKEIVFAACTKWLYNQSDDLSKFKMSFFTLLFFRFYYLFVVN